MVHEVYVPFSVGSVRAALAERERVARCVPGLQLDSAGDAGDLLEGRLRVRIGGSTITYRGSLTLIPQGDGFMVEGSGNEARGSGSAKLSLKLVPRAAEDGDGTRLICSGTVTGDGRISEHEGKTATGAGKRLLDRFCAALADSLRASDAAATDATGDATGDAGEGEPGTPAAPEAAGAGESAGSAGAADETRTDARQAAGLGEPDDNDRAIPGIPGPEKGDRDRNGDRADGAVSPARPGDPEARPEQESGTGAPPPEETTGGVFEAQLPQSSPDPLDDETEDALAAPDAADEDAATAEAAHARRTMIGRSAEEVDHAPPRGRYAPVPPPDAGPATAVLRWAAPAAAAVLAGAVVITRVLRRRG